MRGWAALLALGALLSCSSGPAKGGSGMAGTGGSGAVADGGGGTGGPAGDGAVPIGPTSGLSIRFINTFLPSGTTGPTVDLYDAMELPYGDGSFIVKPVTPLVTGLAFGAVSDYVRPHLAEAGSTAISLAALPAGSPPTDVTDAVEVWSGVDDGSHAQVTLLLENLSPGSLGALGGIGAAVFVEKGDDSGGNAGPLAPAPPAGQGELLASTAPIDVTATVGNYYFFVDDSCTLPLNGDPDFTGTPYLFASPTATPKSFFALFPAAPGAHQLTVVGSPDGVLPTCAQLTARQGATTVTIAAGQQLLAFVYGSSLTDLHLVTAPIAP